MLFDWLVVGQVVRSNPASVVRGPKHVVKRGKTPILDPTEARKLFDSIPTDKSAPIKSFKAARSGIPSFREPPDFEAFWPS